jgi:DNA processing protein
MTLRERLAALALVRTEGVGPIAFRQLLRRFGSAEAAHAALPELARRGGKAGTPMSLAEAEAEMARLRALGGTHVFLGTADYPGRLAATGDAPPVLVALGDLALAKRPCVAIVGARNASAIGLRMARELAQSLASAGQVIVSGLARGVDAAAHRGALSAADGGTIACLAGGIDIVYPPENAALQEEIAGRGLLLSEMPPGTEPQARHFPRRNRLIAGLAAGTVVIEAAPGSGSLITARIAADAGREVMAVPGHPLDPRARGCNRLLKEGAILVEGAADVLAALEPFRLDGPALSREEGRLSPACDPQPGQSRRAGQDTAMPEAGAAPPLPATGEPRDVAALVHGLLSPAPVAIDELVRATGAPASLVQATLTDMELRGEVLRHAGGRVSLA